MRWLALVLLLACDPSPPARDDCTEFVWRTRRGHDPVLCRILYCDDEQALVGMTTLWCDGPDGGLVR